MRKKLLRLNTYGDRNHGGILHCMPTLKVGEATALPLCSNPVSPPMCVHFRPLQPRGLGYYLREYFDILDARMCILERIQRRIGIVDEKKIIAAEHLWRSKS